jgi:hypothetical protein
MYRRIILHKDAIIFKDYKKVFSQDFKVDFSYNAPPLYILVPFHYYQITPTPKAKRCLKHLCLAL